MLSEMGKAGTRGWLKTWRLELSCGRGKTVQSAAVRMERAAASIQTVRNNTFFFFLGGGVFLFADVIIFLIIFEDNGGVRGWAKRLLGVPLEVSLCFFFIKKKGFHFAFYFKVVLLICAQF